MSHSEFGFLPWTKSCKVHTIGQNYNCCFHSRAWRPVLELPSHVWENPLFTFLPFPTISQDKLLVSKDTRRPPQSIQFKHCILVSFVQFCILSDGVFLLLLYFFSFWGWKPGSERMTGFKRSFLNKELSVCSLCTVVYFVCLNEGGAGAGEIKDWALLLARPVREFSTTQFQTFTENPLSCL